MPPLSTLFLQTWHLGTIFHSSHLLTPHIQLVPKSWQLYLANTPRIYFFFSTHSASRFIFLKHTSDDVIILLKSFNCLHLQVPSPEQGKALTAVLNLPFRPQGFHTTLPGPGKIPGCFGAKASIFLPLGLYSCLSLTWPPCSFSLASHNPKACLTSQRDRAALFLSLASSPSCP